MTRDIDIVIELSLGRIDEFTDLFPDSYYNKATIRDEVLRNGIFNIIDHSTGFKLDFILRKKTTYFRQAFARRKRITELDTELWVISLEDLIIAKIFWIQEYKSEKQTQDKWCNALNLKTYDLI